jgi:hypothetical protein
LTGKRQPLTHLHKPTHWLLHFRKDRHGRCSAPGKDVSPSQPLLWTSTFLHHGHRPPIVGPGKLSFSLAMLVATPSPS